MDGVKNLGSGEYSSLSTNQNILNRKNIKQRSNTSAQKGGNSSSARVYKANDNIAMEEMKIALRKEGLGNYLDLMV